MNNDLLSLNPLDSPPPEPTQAEPAGSADLLEQALQATAALNGGDTSVIDTLRQIAETGADTKAAIQASQTLGLYYGSDQVKDFDRAKYYIERVRNLGMTDWADLAACCYIHDKAWSDLSDDKGQIPWEVFYGEFGQQMDQAAEHLKAVVETSRSQLLEMAYDVVFRRGVGENISLQDYRRNWGVVFRLAKRISSTPEVDALIREEAAAQAVMVLRKAKENKSSSKKDYDLAMKENLSKDEQALLKDIGKSVGVASSQKRTNSFLKWGWIVIALAAFFISKFLYAATPSSELIVAIQDLMNIDGSALVAVIVGVCAVLTVIIELLYLPSKSRESSIPAYLIGVIFSCIVYFFIAIGIMLAFELVMAFVNESWAHNFSMEAIWNVGLAHALVTSYANFGHLKKRLIGFIN